MRLSLLYESLEGQTWSGDDGIEYSAPKLVAWARSITKPRPLELAEFADEFREGRHHSDEPDLSPEFIRRAERTDLSFPVLVATSPSGYVIIDGRHRIFKALRAGLTTIPAYVVPLDKLPREAR